jgi:hypothetical protein
MQGHPEHVHRRLKQVGCDPVDQHGQRQAERDVAVASFRELHPGEPGDQREVHVTRRAQAADVAGQ